MKIVCHRLTFRTIDKTLHQHLPSQMHQTDNNKHERKGIDKYANAETTMCTQTTMQSR